MARGICGAGHKAMYHTDWGGLPRKAFFKTAGAEAGRDPRPFCVEDQHGCRTGRDVDRRGGQKKSDCRPESQSRSGRWTRIWARSRAGIKTGHPGQDHGYKHLRHDGRPDGQSAARHPGPLWYRPRGRSCPATTASKRANRPSDEDIFNWFVKNLVPAKYTAKGDAHINLTREAEKLAPGESGLLALDWNNGNRTVLVDPLLTGLLVGQTLHTTAPEIYRALVEATAFGALAIINRLEEYGVEVREVINCVAELPKRARW